MQYGMIFRIGFMVAAVVGFMGWLVYRSMFDPGTLHVLGPVGREVTVVIDGGSGQRVSAGAHAAFKAKQGPHKVVIDGGPAGPTTHHVSVRNGFHEQVLPAGEQCLVLFEVTKNLYPGSSAQNGLGLLPTIEARLIDHAATDLPIRTYLSLNELPRVTSEGSHVKLLVELNCDAVKESTDSELVTTAGFRGY